MSIGAAKLISLFRAQIENRRFDEETVRILESVLVSKDVKSLVDVRSSLRDFMRRESVAVVHEIAHKSVELKLLILDFLVRSFALIGDVESCLALRYEALVMREEKCADNQWLRISHSEWFIFAKHSFDAGFFSIARKACEKALICFQKNNVVNPKTDGFMKNQQVVEKIKRLKDAAVVSVASHSVQALAAEYLKKKKAKQSPSHPLVSGKVKCSASTMFRNGIKKRNISKLQECQRLPEITFRSQTSQHQGHF